MRFLCDIMLGKLVRYLRMLGLDAPYIRNAGQLKHYSDESSKTIFLTRRTLKDTSFDKCIIIKSVLVDEQLEEIKDILRPLIKSDSIMSRCIGCNTPLVNADKYEIERFVPEYVFHRYNMFSACPVCKKVYWRGSHAEHMMGWIGKFMTNCR